MLQHPGESAEAMVFYQIAHGGGSELTVDSVNEIVQAISVELGKMREIANKGVANDDSMRQCADTIRIALSILQKRDEQELEELMMEKSSWEHLVATMANVEIKATHY